MERGQFIELLENKGSRDKATIGSLQDLVVRFPYCQTGQLLLAKCMHDQENMLFDQQLKTTAAYVADRKILYELIHRKDEAAIEPEAPIFKESPVSPFSSSVFKEADAAVPLKQETENIFIETSSTENIFKEDFTEAKNEIPETSEIQITALNSDNEFPNRDTERFSISQEDDSILEIPEEKILDPHEVIRKRLNEILGKPEIIGPDFSGTKDSEEKSPEAIETEERELQPEAKDPGVTASNDQKVKKQDRSVLNTINEEEIISTQAKNVRDVIDKIGLEHAMEESIIHSIERFPVIQKEEQHKRESVKDTAFQDTIKENETHSFLYWLKLKSTSDFGQLEEVRSDKDETTEAQENQPESLEKATANAAKDELISQFIATEPRIVPSKAEFYSPVNQARKSIADHEDLVSETLAKIYFNQGNLLKARMSYQKLSLLHPEKSDYFAALILEIDHLLNNQVQ